MPVPEETASSPCLAPGCDGVKLSTTEHDAPPASVAPQLVDSVKSPATVRLSGNGSVPVFVTVTVWVFAESAGHDHRIRKIESRQGRTTRFGFALSPPAPGCGIVLPVNSTLAP